jgi:hypothetical protein
MVRKRRLGEQQILRVDWKIFRLPVPGSSGLCKILRAAKMRE